MSLFRGSFRLRGSLHPTLDKFAPILGFVVFAILWHAGAWLLDDVLHKRNILPYPMAVARSFPALLKLGLVHHTIQSLTLNALGYLGAIALALPLGIGLALWPLPEALVRRPLASLRGLPLPALTGVFIVALGIERPMKAAFLAVGIFVYLLPTIMSRVAAVPPVYDQTARTLGASIWQRIWSVYVPGSLPGAYSDIGILVPISWTYITIAEVINSGEGGLGAVGYRAQQTGHVEQTYAILAIIIAIIWAQDAAFSAVGRRLFPYREGMGV